MGFDLVIPAIEKDSYILLSNLRWIKKFIDYDRLIIIGDGSVKTALDVAFGDIVYLNEEDVIDKESVRLLMTELAAEDDDCKARMGWYYQQFLKMQYARICEKDYYLAWDSDTIPLHKVEMIKDGKPIFDIKTEHNPVYFETIKNIFGINRAGKYSFISEHMLFSTVIMKEMLDSIENTYKSEKTAFWEIILRAIPKGEVKYSGFSEFETYGTYCMNLHPGEYTLRRWHSTRNGGYYFDKDSFGDDEIKWLRPYYDAVSFEKGTQRKYGKYPGQTGWIRKYIPGKILINIIDALWTIRFSKHRVYLFFRYFMKRE